MTIHTQGPVTIQRYVSQSLTVGEPDVSGSLAVYPIFGPQPQLVYISMANAHAQGFVVKELPGGASVRDLVVSNPLSVPVLIFEGEGVIGAQQNRTVDKSVLIGPGEQVTIPVSCVEAGRWDGSRHDEEFLPAPHTAHPSFRGAKARQAAGARSAGAEERADQHAVWGSVDSDLNQMGVNSGTGSLDDGFNARRGNLDEIASGIHLHGNQIGAVVQIGNEVRAVDLVSRPDVYAQLHKPLVRGYSLDGLVEEGRSAKPGDLALGGRFLNKAIATQILEADGIGMGRDFRFESPDFVGAGLVSGDELIQLSVFAGGSEGASAQADHSAPTETRINRPSRRRR